MAAGGCPNATRFCAMRAGRLAESGTPETLCTWNEPPKERKRSISASGEDKNKVNDCVFNRIRPELKN